MTSFVDDQPSKAVGRQLPGAFAGNVRVIRDRGIDKLRRCVEAGKEQPHEAPRRNHASTDVLLDYWLTYVPRPPTRSTSTDAADECGEVRRPDRVVTACVRRFVPVRFGVTSDVFLQRLVAQGLRVRAYRLSHNGSVNWTVVL